MSLKQVEEMVDQVLRLAKEPPSTFCTTWLCFHCQKAIATVKDGRISPVAGCQVVWVNGNVPGESTKLYFCLHCGALQMPPRFKGEVEKPPTATAEKTPEWEQAAKDREDARRYRVLRRLFSENRPSMLIRVMPMEGEVAIHSAREELSRGVNLDNALDKVKEAV